MRELRWYAANLLAGFMDFGVGALIAAAVFAAGGSAAWWQLLAGGFFALLPDMDNIWPILRGRVEKDHHATVMHMPLLVLPLVAIAAFILGGALWGATALLCVLWHYVHDTPPLGGGIRWLWPLGDEKMREQPYHELWIQKNWMRMSRMMVFEVGTGLAALVAAILIASR